MKLIVNESIVEVDNFEKKIISLHMVYSHHLKDEEKLFDG
jgi:hypothetical protein